MRATRLAAGIAATVALLAGCSGDGSSGSTGSTAPPASTTTAPPGTTVPSEHPSDHGTMDPADRAAAQLATAGFQDVETAEAAGYASSLDALGCFEDAERGGMGVHYIDQALMDDTVDEAAPEALVYELDADGEIAGLVAHEYIVPLEAWTAAEPPSLFGTSFHQHPTLPLWVLHTWLWKDNPTGVFEDWNPAVRLCPDDAPIFGVDLPAPAETVTTQE
ncbi:MAG: hypothetical protein ABW195_00285 [Ilumatobacteraceae bacterium]